VLDTALRAELDALTAIGSEDPPGNDA
jgi:hypothetical protein